MESFSEVNEGTVLIYTRNLSFSMIFQTSKIKTLISLKYYSWINPKELFKYFGWPISTVVSLLVSRLKKLSVQFLARSCILNIYSQPISLSILKQCACVGYRYLQIRMLYYSELVCEGKPGRQWKLLHATCNCYCYMLELDQ